MITKALNPAVLILALGGMACSYRPAPPRLEATAPDGTQLWQFLTPDGDRVYFSARGTEWTWGEPGFLVEVQAVGAPRQAHFFRVPAAQGTSAIAASHSRPVAYH